MFNHGEIRAWASLFESVVQHIDCLEMLIDASSVRLNGDSEDCYGTKWPPAPPTPTPLLASVLFFIHCGNKTDCIGSVPSIRS